jgi:sugar phosphate isomerase/epimerase
MYSRRTFGKLALAGLPLSMALAKINSKISGVQLGVQSYSFRDRPLDAAIQAMKEIGLGECELYASHVEPAGMMRPRPPQGAPGAGGGGAGRPPQGTPGGPPEAGAKRPPQNDPARLAAREELRKWRLSVSLDHFKAVRKQFDDAGINLHAYNLSFNDSFTDEEIDRGFQMARALGVKVLTASTTVTVARRLVPFAEKHKITVAMHGHSNLTDPNQFAKPESFAAAMALSKYFAVNLDIGHFFAAGYDPVEYIEAHHDRISNLHLKDRKKSDGPNVPWGEGDTPIKQVLQLLKDKKYPIPADIEYEYKGEDAVAEVKKCFEYCRNALA